MKKWNTNKKTLITFIIYLVFTFILIFFHENWRDEAQAWLLVRDCNIPELIEAMKYEGHFLLWYFILMPFVKLGFPYVTTNIISWIITSISVWLILKKAPFKFYKRVLLIFSLPLLYLYPIISRCYCLIPLAIVLMCIFYKDRKEKPFRYLMSIIFLSNTHVIMLGMSGIVLLDYIIEFIKDWKTHSKEETNKRLISFVVAIILLIVSMLPLLNCLTTNKDIGKNDNIMQQIAYAIIYYPAVLILTVYDFFATNEIITIAILSLIIITFLYDVKKSKSDYLKIYICILWQSIIYSFIYKLSLQRATTIIFVLLYFKWINAYKEKKELKIFESDFEKKFLNSCWIVLMIIHILGGLLYITFKEINYSSSSAHDMGKYINENIENDSIILNGPRVEFATSIIPYVNKDVKFYHIQGNRYFSYAIWDEKNRKELHMEDIENLKNIFDENQKLYYIYCNNKAIVGEEVAEVDEKDLVNECVRKEIFKELYNTNTVSVSSEDYIIYEVNLNEW